MFKRVHYIILLSLISGKVTCLAFSKVHPAALFTQAFRDIPRLNLVLTNDSVLLHDSSHVDPILVHDTSDVDSMSTQVLIQVLKNTYMACDLMSSHQSLSSLTL